MNRRRRPLAAALILAALAVACAAAAPSAGAAVRDPVPDIPTGGHVVTSPVAHAANLPYGGGPVLHFNRTYLIFWQPAGSGLTFDPGYVNAIETFLARVAHDSHLPTNVYSLSGQYHDATGPAAYSSIYGGAILDTEPLPARDLECNEPAAPPLDTGPGWSDCVSDQQVQYEVTRVVTAHRLPTTLNDVYFVVTPSGFGECDTTSLPPVCALAGSNHGGFCGYHSSTADQVLYAVIPYNAISGHCQSDSPRPNASTADPALSSLSHEHNEMLTDPLDDAYIDGSFNEDGDLCIDMTKFPPPTLGGSGSSIYDEVIDGGHYWLQMEWSNDDHGCAARDEADSLSTTGPGSVRAGNRATFRGGPSTRTGGSPLTPGRSATEPTARAPGRGTRTNARGVTP